MNSRGGLEPGVIREASVSGHVETRKGLCSFVANKLLGEAIPQDAAFQQSTRCQMWGQRGSDGGAFNFVMVVPYICL